MLLKSVLAGAAVVVGLVGLAPAAFAGYHETVQLNSGATANVYQSTAPNKVFGACETVDPKISSPVLTFGAPNYGYGNAGYGSANVSANATLKSGVGPGRYVLVMDCGDKQARVDFTVPAKRVTTTPVGAPQTGGGSTATLFE